jgi:hypothetical protein
MMNPTVSARYTELNEKQENQAETHAATPLALREKL